VIEIALRSPQHGYVEAHRLGEPPVAPGEHPTTIGVRLRDWTQGEGGGLAMLGKPAVAPRCRRPLLWQGGIEDGMIEGEASIMTPQFVSTELNQLLQLELAEGSYHSSEEALLAGLKALRESRDAGRQLAYRLASFQDGRAIVLDGDEALGGFLDGIDAEVDIELQAQSRRNA
jgi:hypothetical protein